jgi:thiosulfate reductase cytochrome b subunit
MARWEHFFLMIGFISFFVIHIVQVIRAGWDLQRSREVACAYEN